MKLLVVWTRRALLALFLLVMAWHLWLLANVLWLKWFNPSETSFMDIRLSELQAKKPEANLRYRWVAYEQISVHLKRAVVAAEDD